MRKSGFLEKKMLLKVSSVFVFFAVCATALAQTDSELEKKMQNDCQILAKEINKSHGVQISLAAISPLVTWRASCAEKPPTGAGNVTALCQGNVVAIKGKYGVFFWQKSQQGKLNHGYFVCGG